MDYLKAGQYINFGLSRGLGSVSYAAGAVLVGQLIDIINPTVIGYVHLLSSVLLLVLLFSMPDYKIEEDNPQENKSNIFTIIKNYKTFFIILVAFAFMFAASTSLSTYLINIVKNLGGNTSLYGIAIFCMAASEMPVMSMTHHLLKKYKAETLILVASGFYIFKKFYNLF